MYPGYNMIIKPILAFVRLGNSICSQFKAGPILIFACILSSSSSYRVLPRGFCQARVGNRQWLAMCAVVSALAPSATLRLPSARLLLWCHLICLRSQSHASIRRPSAVGQRIVRFSGGYGIG